MEALAEAGEGAVDANPHVGASRGYQAVRKNEVRSLISQDDVDMLDTMQFVFGPKVERGTTLWPVISFSWHVENETFRIKSRVALFCESDTGTKATAWRFEPPEGTDAQVRDRIGSHCFFHAQPITAWQKNGDGSGSYRLPIPAWLNTSQPSFPIYASHHYELPAAMMISIYGLTHSRSILEPQIFQMRSNFNRQVVAHLHEFLKSPSEAESSDT